MENYLQPKPQLISNERIKTAFFKQKNAACVKIKTQCSKNRKIRNL